MSIFYLILAIFGLGFLIFIHELGHYFMAIKAGMKVEVFSIGFGKPLRTWKHRGVLWQVCILPFGGYVRIAGMEKKDNLDPRLVPDGFYSRGPWGRIQVACSGPFVNIVFALLAFTCIWSLGGRIKPFSNFTQIVGWVDETSPLHTEGLRPGDHITSYANTPFKGYNDLIYATILKSAKAPINGYHTNYMQGINNPFSIPFDPQKDVRDLSSASYLIYTHPIADSPVLQSSLQPQDRILWVNGHLIFSQAHLSQVLNNPSVLLTISRDSSTHIVNVPRLYARDIRLSLQDSEELDDWRHAANLKGKVPDLYFIPYSLSSQGSIERVLSYLDETAEEKKPQDTLLEIGDKIVAVDGIPTSSAVKILETLQTKHALIVVERSAKPQPLPSWKNEDSTFYANIPWDPFKSMIQSIGTPASIHESGPLHLLQPIPLKKRSEFAVSQSETVRNRLESRQEQINNIEDPKQRAEALSLFENQRQKFMLGIQLQDRPVIYNPGPFTLFSDVCKDTWRTLSSLLKGNLNPKWMSGPVGIVQVIHHSWALGFKEALFWMGVISLNLGLLNLLPLPVLDGGHICFALFEKITKKPISAKMMDKLIFPFVLLLIGFLIFVTYNDILRLIGRWI